MSLWLWVALASGSLVFLLTRGRTPSTVSRQEPRIASFYGPGFHGKQTANGEVFDQNALTAAHRNLPFGTRVRVTDVDNGRSVVVRINDRGPFTKKNGEFAREIDLSVGAAAAIGLDIQRGLARVVLEVL